MSSPALVRQSDFEELLPLLVSTYQRGRLVPFLGAGMSANRLVLWRDFLKALEEKAHLPPGECEGAKMSPDARAQRACSVIQNRGGRKDLLDAITTALDGTGQGVPEQTKSLAAMCWPLVVSTNYDDLFFYESRNSSSPEHELSVQVLGRSPKDCKLIVSSLTGPFDRQYVWHIQGFLGGQHAGGGHVEKDVPDLAALRDQLVIGHGEYRAVTNRSPHFRRCFGEVFNSRSFLFLGSSLTEDYFLNLFGEILDLCGPSAVPHFAFTKQGQVNAKFLADQMNIMVCEFEDWPTLPKWLDCLKAEIEAPKARSVSRSFVMGSTGVDLEIVLADAPPTAPPHTAIAFVAQQNGGRPVPSGPFATLDAQDANPVGNHRHLFKFQGSEIYAVTARPTGTENESAVSEAVGDLLFEICKESCGISTLHLQMSQSGGSVPPVFGFIEAVRAFADWKRRSGGHILRLIVHIQSAVHFNLCAERIDVQELLTSELIRFWAVVCSRVDAEPIRRALRYPPETKLSKVLDDLDVPRDLEKWSLSICPSPRKAPDQDFCQRIDRYNFSGRTLIEIGVVFGSVLLFEYEEALPSKPTPLLAAHAVAD